MSSWEKIEIILDEKKIQEFEKEFISELEISISHIPSRVFGHVDYEYYFELAYDGVIIPSPSVVGSQDTIQNNYLAWCDDNKILPFSERTHCIGREKEGIDRRWCEKYLISHNLPRIKDGNELPFEPKSELFYSLFNELKITSSKSLESYRFFANNSLISVYKKFILNQLYGGYRITKAQLPMLSHDGYECFGNPKITSEMLYDSGVSRLNLGKTKPKLSFRFYDTHIFDDGYDEKACEQIINWFARLDKKYGVRK